MRIKEYLRPTTLEEAYNILKNKKTTIIGGGTYLRLGVGEIDTALDLSKLKIDTVVDKGGFIEIGAMVTLREIEKNQILKDNFSGVVSKTVSGIMGVQFRNIATLGGNLGGRYAFSDVLTPLLTLDTYIEFYKRERISLKDFLEEKGKLEDIITKIIIVKDERKASFESLRNTSTDFAILNAAVSNKDGDFKISIGARPGTPQLAEKAMEFLKTAEINEEAAIRAGELAAEEITFGEDIRGSKEYRKDICKVLVKRSIMEVM